MLKVRPGAGCGVRRLGRFWDCVLGGSKEALSTTKVVDIKSGVFWYVSENFWMKRNTKKYKENRVKPPVPTKQPIAALTSMNPQKSLLERGDQISPRYFWKYLQKAM